MGFYIVSAPSAFSSRAFSRGGIDIHTITQLPGGEDLAQ
jgi:hypothetical protein